MVVVVPSVREQPRGEALGTDLERERSIARGHETLRNERTHGECEEHYSCDQQPRGFMGETDAHRSAGVDLLRRPEEKYYTKDRSGPSFALLRRC